MNQKKNIVGLLDMLKPKSNERILAEFERLMEEGNMTPDEVLSDCIRYTFPPGVALALQRGAEPDGKVMEDIRDSIARREEILSMVTSARNKSFTKQQS